jgi:hypothetical protein
MNYKFVFNNLFRNSLYLIGSYLIYSYNMRFCQTVDKGQLYNLLTGMLGIYILYFIAGILH